MYHYKRQTDIDFVRYIMFEAKSKPNGAKRPLDGIKCIDPSTFPPCKKVLEQQIKRAWYIAKLYRTSTQQYPCEEHTPIDYGWKLSRCKEYLEIDWFHGDQVPQKIEDVAEKATDNECDDEEDESESELEESEGSDLDDDEDLEF